MKALRICGLLSLPAIAVLGWVSAALSDSVKAPSSAYLSDYVYLHETRGLSDSIQIAAHADVCRGSVRRARRPISG
ncbi:MAG TPA: hypothetical protein VIF38_04045 [Burkholderiales bacterium]